MIVHLILSPDGEPFGVYKDGEVVKQGWRLDAIQILKALGITCHLIHYSPDDFKFLPKTVGEIPITELLMEDE